MAKVTFRYPPEVLALEESQKAELIKSLSEQLGLSVHTSHNHERTMWTDDEIPLIAEMENWFYQNLVGGTAFLMNEVLQALELDSWSMAEVTKSFGEESMDLLSKADGGFKLADLIRMNRDSRTKLIKYVADGGAYTRGQLQELEAFITSRTPNYARLLESYAVRGVFLGKLKSVADKNSLEMLGVMLSQLPVRIEQVTRESTPLSLRSKGGLVQAIEVPSFTPAEVEAVQYAEQHAARYVTKASEALKHDIQEAVTHARRNRMSSQELKQRLLDEMGEQNRDWRRIALTELTDVMANGYLASLPAGTRVIGQGAANACPHCQRLIIGKEYVKSDAPDDPDRFVWVGKSNVGKKAKERQPTIPLHPTCRCRWMQLSTFQRVDEHGNITIKPLEELIEEYKQRGLVHPEYTMDHGAPREEQP